MYLIFFIVSYNIFYLPVSVCFDVDATEYMLILEYTVVFIQVLDIFIRCYTLKFDENGTPIKDRELTIRNYINKNLSFDLISCFPFDILLMSLEVDRHIYRVLRFLRLFKIPRLFDYWS